MDIIFRGYISYSISIERSGPLANTLVRVYRSNLPESSLIATFLPKSIRKKDVGNKDNRLLGETYSTTNGYYEIACRNVASRGEDIEVEMHLCK